MTKITQHPDRYGFQNVTESCVEDNAIPYCTGYLFFNDKHPTVAVEQLIANELAKQISLNGSFG